MNDALYIAATGMKTQTAQIDTIANNVANASTPGFKRSQLRFGDLMVAAPAGSGTGAAGAMQPALDGVLSMGTPAGVALAGEQRSFTAGELRRVDDAMALAIQGEGFLELALPDGSAAYTRGGHLELNAERLLSTAGGLALKPRIHVPTDVHQVQIRADGEVLGFDEQGRSTPLGRLDLVNFSRPAGLSPMGDGLWRATQASGDALSAPAGEAGLGRLQQGFQEASNVQLVEEMVQLMAAQRAYEMNVKVIQAADEIAGMTNNLRK